MDFQISQSENEIIKIYGPFESFRYFHFCDMLLFFSSSQKHFHIFFPLSLSFWLFMLKTVGCKCATLKLINSALLTNNDEKLCENEKVRNEALFLIVINLYLPYTFSPLHGISYTWTHSSWFPLIASSTSLSTQYTHTLLTYEIMHVN